MSMIRKEIKQGAITIAYGYDKVAGYWLHVVDTRLVAEGEDEAWDELCESVHCSGDGSYLFVHTRDVEFGKIVDKKVMERLWKAYGVPEEGLALLDLTLPILEDLSIEGILEGLGSSAR